MPYSFRPFSTLSPTESSTLMSHYHGHGRRDRGCSGQHHGIHCNYCNYYSHIEVECHTNVREQQWQPRVDVVAQSTITKDVVITSIDYNMFLKFKASHQPSL